MPNHKIICPYCFNEFMDDQVHFRMETVIAEEELDPLGRQRTRNEIEMDPEFSTSEIKAQLAEYDRREKFAKRDDEKYELFWKDYGGTTEKASVSRDGVAPKVMPYQRPVFDPNNPNHRQFFGEPKRVEDVINDSGLVYAAIDCFGKKTERRVCPHCHNPLPGAYGKYPVKFISVIGISGAGKTVYLSQLCKYISKQISYFNVTATPTSIYAQEYLSANPVVMGKRLPIGTPPEQLLQPLCFDLIYREEDNSKYQTVVFYDIAGENCVDVDKIRGFGKFVENSNGIILLIDPDQFKEGESKAEPVLVLQTIYNLFANKSMEAKDLPLAICISKGDMVAKEMISQNLEDITYVTDRNGTYLPLFNAEDYNPIHDSIMSFISHFNNQLLTMLRNLYDNYNYFLFSAIGTSVKKMDDSEYNTPAGPAIPKRILEPVVWMLYKYNYFNTNVEIHEPEDWFCNSCGKRLRNTEKYCPKCKTNNKGEWECPRCHTVQSGEWCTTKGCRTNRFGNRKSLIGQLMQKR